MEDDMMERKGRKKGKSVWGVWRDILLYLYNIRNINILIISTLVYYSPGYIDSSKHPI